MVQQQQKQQQKEQLPTAQGYGVSDFPFPLSTSLRPVVALVPDGGKKKGPARDRYVAET